MPRKSDELDDDRDELGHDTDEDIWGRADDTDEDAELEEIGQLDETDEEDEMEGR